MRNLLRFYGLLDIALIAWVAISAGLAGEIPIFDDLAESVGVARAFGSPLSIALAVGAFALLISVAVSGPLLLLLKRPGVYLALFQAPFRMLWVIQPSFFFLAVWKGGGAVYWAQIALILALELFKAVSMIVWLKNNHARVGAGTPNFIGSSSS